MMLQTALRDSLPSLSSVRDAVGLMVDKFQRWLATAVVQLPNLLVAVLVAVAFWLVARAVRTGLSRALKRAPIPIPIRSLLTNVVSIAVFLAGIFVALGVLGLDKTVTSLLAGVGIVGLALGFAFQDIAANFMSGIILAVRRPFEVGHLIRSNEFLGVVNTISLRSTVMRQLTGEQVRLPNKDVLGNPIINYSATGERRVDLSVGVSYGDDLEKVRRVAVRAVEGLDCLKEGRAVELFYEGFGDSSISFSIRFWVSFARQPDYLSARSEAVMAIKRAFDAEDITIPFPIRTLDFAKVGGTTLPDALRPVLREQHGAQGSAGEG